MELNCTFSEGVKFLIKSMSLTRQSNLLLDLARTFNCWISCSGFYHCVCECSVYQRKMFSLCVLLDGPVNVRRHSFKHHKLRYTHHLLVRELCLYYYRRSWTPLIPNHNEKQKQILLATTAGKYPSPHPVYCWWNFLVTCKHSQKVSLQLTAAFQDCL